MKKLKKVVSKDIEILDANTSVKEIFKESLINFTYGLVGNLMVPFIVAKSDAGILISMGLYYFMLSYILNRAKYETNLGKYVILPIPAVLGAYIAIKIGYLITNYV